MNFGQFDLFPGESVEEGDPYYHNKRIQISFARSNDGNEDD